MFRLDYFSFSCEFVHLDALKKTVMRTFKLGFGFILLLFLQISTFGQTENRQKSIALEIINQSAFCSLTTLDEEGIPESRMMQTLPVGEDFVIWLGTKSNSQKVTQINNNPKVSVYYTEAHSTGYVNVQGEAEIINDEVSKSKHYKEGWDAYYPNKDEDFILIKITPIKLQIVSYAQGIVSTKEDWRAEEIIFK